jgi:histidinol-phosphatase (PHP family)
MKDVLMDLHTHSSFSPDATDSAEKMCHRGAELGLTAYGITEHCDCNFWNTIDELSENQENIIDKEMYGARVYATESIAEQIRLKEIFGKRPSP